MIDSLATIDRVALAGITGGDGTQLAFARGVATANGLSEPANVHSSNPASYRNMGRGTVFCGSSAGLDSAYKTLLATHPTEMGLNGHAWVKNGVQTSRSSESVDARGFRCMHIAY